jgi:hypothetical protein
MPVSGSVAHPCSELDRTCTHAHMHGRILSHPGTQPSTHTCTHKHPSRTYATSLSCTPLACKLAYSPARFACCPHPPPSPATTPQLRQAQRRHRHRGGPPDPRRRGRHGPQPHGEAGGGPAAAAARVAPGRGDVWQREGALRHTAARQRGPIRAAGGEELTWRRGGCAARVLGERGDCSGPPCHVWFALVARGASPLQPALILDPSACHFWRSCDLVFVQLNEAGERLL